MLVQTWRSGSRLPSGARHPRPHRLTGGIMLRGADESNPFPSSGGSGGDWPATETRSTVRHSSIRNLTTPRWCRGRGASAEPACDRAKAAAGGLHRRAGAAMRLLPEWLDHDGGRFVTRHASPLGAANPRRAFRPQMPLRDAYGHLARRSARGAGGVPKSLTHHLSVAPIFLAVRGRRTSPNSLKPQRRPRLRTKKWRLDGASPSSALKKRTRRSALTC